MSNLFERAGVLNVPEIAFDQPCVVRDILDRIGDQWSLLVLGILSEQPRRFNQLAREIGDISKQMLARTLRKLEQDGFVMRTVLPGKPPGVEYSLTVLGQSFLEPLEVLLKWAGAHHEAITVARTMYREEGV